MTVEAIQKAIRKLPGPDRRKLAEWIEELDAQAWDREIARDFSPGGKGQSFLEEVNREIALQHARPFEEGLREFRPGPRKRK